MTTAPQVGDLVQEAAAGTTRPWVRLALAQLALSVLAMLITVGLLLWVVDYLGDAKTRDEAIADIVAAFADLATADTPAEQRQALERINEARRRLPEDNPVRRELERRPPTTQGSEGGTPPTTAIAAPQPTPEQPRGSPTTTGSTSTTTTSTTTPLLTVDPPQVGPIDLPPVTVPCVGFVCRMAIT